jgi:ABC-type branched-subunit amino acid transport system substrate-binding protein
LGVLSNLKGANAFDARFLSTRAAMEIAVDEINESNFLGNGYKLQVTYGDDYVRFVFLWSYHDCVDVLC